MRMLQGMNLSQEKYALYCSVYSGMFAFSSYYYFSSCISWIAPGHSIFSSGGRENISQLTCSCYNMTLLLPIGRWYLCPFPLETGYIFVPIIIWCRCDAMWLPRQGQKRRGSFLLALILETLTLGIGAGHWDCVLWGHLGHVHKSCVGGSGGGAQLRSWLTVSKEYQSCEVASLWVDIGTRHHLLATSGKCVELDSYAQSTLRTGRDKKRLLLFDVTTFAVVHCARC